MAWGLSAEAEGDLGTTSARSPVTFAFPNSGDTDRLLSGGLAPYRVGFNGGIALGAVLSQTVTVGVAGSACTFSGDTDNEVTLSQISRVTWRVGPFIRRYYRIPTSAVFLSGSAGIEFSDDLQNYRFGTEGRSIEEYGIAFPISVGLEYAFTAMLHIGPSVTYSPTLGLVGCHSLSEIGSALGASSVHSCSRSF